MILKRGGRLVVCHLTTVHPSSDGRIFEKECCSLAAAGYEVCLVSPPEKPREVEGIQIVTLHRYRNRLLRMTVGAVLALLKVLLLKPAVVHFHDPELIPIGLVLKCSGIITIYDVHEDVPNHVANKSWLPKQVGSILVPLAKVAQAVAGRTFDGIVAATEIIAAQFPKSKTVTVRNFALVQRSGEVVSSKKIGSKDRDNVFVYVGGISVNRGIFEILEALHVVAAFTPVTLHLAGQFGPSSLLAEAQQHPGWKNVYYHGVVSRAEVEEILAGAAAGLVVLRPIQSYIDSLPTKLLEYMQAGLPVIASDFPQIRSIVESAGCGFLVDPLDAKAIAQAMVSMITDPDAACAMGKRGREMVQLKYSWENEAERLRGFYEQLLEQHGWVLSPLAADKGRSC